MKRKNLINGLVMLFIFLVTCYTVFHDSDVSQILYWVTHVKESFLLLGILTIPVFVCCESVIIKYLMRKLGKDVPFGSCATYSFIGFFFSCITPSASGGQPAQVLQMQEDGIDVTLSSLVLIIVTIGYKMVLVMIGGLCFLLARTWLEDMMGGAMIFFYLGMGLNMIGITGLLFLVFSRNLATLLIEKTIFVLELLHILKRKPERREKLRRRMAEYHRAATFIKENPQILLPVLFISLFQRIVLFFVTYLVYLSFGLHGSDIFTIVILQAIISLSVDMLPLPGGMGISENLFLLIFARVFGSQLILPAMLLSRGISFYILLFLSAAVTIYARLAPTKKWRAEV